MHTKLLKYIPLSQIMQNWFTVKLKKKCYCAVNGKAFVRLSSWERHRWVCGSLVLLRFLISYDFSVALWWYIRPAIRRHRIWILSHFWLTNLNLYIMFFHIVEYFSSFIASEGTGTYRTISCLRYSSEVSSPKCTRKAR